MSAEYTIFPDTSVDRRMIPERRMPVLHIAEYLDRRDSNRRQFNEQGVDIISPSVDFDALGLGKTALVSESDVTFTSAEIKFVEYTNSPANTYLHRCFTEHEEPELAKLAWRIHAEGYYAMGFVSENAITEDGYMAADIDKSRGAHTEYYIAQNPSNIEDIATWRKINIAPGDSFRDLPAYKICEDRLNPIGMNLLEQLTGQDARIKEIAALAKTRHGSPIGVHEIIRKSIQEAMGKNEVWFFSIVSSTFDTLAKSFSQENFTVIGEDVPINDDRVNDAIALRPAIVFPDTFISTIYDQYTKADDPKQKQRFLRSFIFLTDGIDKSLITDEMAATRCNLLNI